MRQRREASSGIDLGNHSIKLARIETEEDGRRVLTHWGIESLSEPEAWSGALKKLLRRLELKPRQMGRTSASVGGRHVHVRQVTLPRLAPRDLHRALPFEARKHFPLDSIPHPVLDMQILGGLESPEEGDGNGSCEVLVAVSPRRELNAVLSALGSVGIDPEGVDAEPLPSINALQDAYPFRGEDDAIAILDLGATSSALAAAHAKGGLYVRPIEFTGEVVLAVIREEQQCDGAAAELWLRETSTENNRRSLGLDTMTKALGVEVRETLRYLKIRRRDWRVSRLVVCGGMGLAGDVLASLRSGLGMEVHPADPFLSLEIEGEAPPERERMLYPGAVGLAGSRSRRAL